MYYDMSGFDYGILDVVQVLHLRKRRGNYYDCPFCGETHGKLNINVEKNVFRCNRCDASGGMLKLYADLHNVTLSEANQQIREALGKGEYRTDYIKATPVQEEKATAELAPIEEIHRTYQRVSSYRDYDTGTELSAMDRIVTLSTCVNSRRNYRYLVHGKLSSEIITEE